MSGFSLKSLFIILYRLIDIIYDFITFYLRAHSQDQDIFIMQYASVTRLRSRQHRLRENKCPGYISAQQTRWPNQCGVPFRSNALK